MHNGFSDVFNQSKSIAHNNASDANRLWQSWEILLLSSRFFHKLIFQTFQVIFDFMTFINCDQQTLSGNTTICTGFFRFMTTYCNLSRNINNLLKVQQFELIERLRAQQQNRLALFFGTRPIQRMYCEYFADIYDITVNDSAEKFIAILTSTKKIWD